MISYDEKTAMALFDRIEAAFTRELIAEKSGGGDPSSMPIFVIGMPRSGTTLIEQIIASHPQVHGAGELKTFNDVVLTVHGPDGKTIPYPEFVPALAAAPLKQIGCALSRIGARSRYPQRRREKGCTAVTDKMPSNYYFAGLDSSRAAERKDHSHAAGSGRHLHFLLLETVRRPSRTTLTISANSAATTDATNN